MNDGGCSETPVNGNGNGNGDGEEAVCGQDPATKGCKVPGAHMAVGYWGRDIHAHIFANQEQARQRALLTEQILAGSIRAALWRGVTEGPQCACYKESNQQADRKCGACHGVGLVPGYVKFGYETFWLSGSDPDASLTGVTLTEGWKSAKVVLEAGETTGVIESVDMPFTRDAFGSAWSAESLYFLPEEEESSVVVEYSLDGGDTWAPIETLCAVNPTGNMIRFRATLNRDTAAVITPQFEIIRARFSRIPLSMPSAGQYRMGPWILIMREPPKTRHRKYEYGDIPVEDGLSFWTAGLAFFDPEIEAGSEEELLKGPLTFIEVLDGARTGTRYVTTSWQNSDPFGYILVSQTFEIRIADPAGPFSLVY